MARARRRFCAADRQVNWCGKAGIPPRLESESLSSIGARSTFYHRGHRGAQRLGWLALQSWASCCTGEDDRQRKRAPNITNCDFCYCFRSTRNRASAFSFSPRDPKVSSEARAACASASAFLSD